MQLKQPRHLISNMHAFSPSTLVIAALPWSLMAASPLAMAEAAVDAPLTELRTWTIPGSEIDNGQSQARPFRLRLEMAVVAGGAARWTPDIVLGAAKHVAAILAQCDIGIDRVRLHEFDAPERYRCLSMLDSREFARRSELAKPAVFFVDDTRQRPAFDAEAVGRANAKTRPEMQDTVWVTAATRDLPIVLAHELVHVLADSGEHSDAPDNLMREVTAPGSTRLTPAQCRGIVAMGQRNGLLEHTTETDRPPSR